MPELVQVTVYLDQDTAARYLAAGERRQKDPRRIMAEDLHDAAQFLPAPPPPIRKRSQQELRDESRARNGGVSAHTAAMRRLRPDGSPQ